MDPSSKHKSLLKSKIKKRRKLVLVESLGDEKKKLETKKGNIETKKPSIIIEDDKIHSPLTLKLEKKESKDVSKKESKNKFESNHKSEEKDDDIDIKIKATKVKKQLDTIKIK